MATDKHAVQCSKATKNKLTDAAATLKWAMPDVLELAAELLAARIDGEETPAQKKARILGQPKSHTSTTGVRSKSDATATPVNGVREPVSS